MYNEADVACVPSTILVLVVPTPATVLILPEAKLVGLAVGDTGPLVGETVGLAVVGEIVGLGDDDGCGDGMLVGPVGAGVGMQK